MAEVAPDPRFGAAKVLFFGVGAQKCGTTWLYRFLQSHDDVCVPRRKELQYWNTLEQDIKARIRNLASVVAAQGAEKGKNSFRMQLRILRRRDPAHTSYADVLFRNYGAQTAVGEITPDYDRLSEQGFARLAALNPDTRFIFLMRDPIDRLHSSMRKLLRSRADNDRTAVLHGDAVLDELKNVLADESASPIRRSAYDQTIRTLEKAVDPAKIGLFFYENIFGGTDADPICDFLSIRRKPGNFDHVANVGNPVFADRAREFRAMAMPHLAATYDYMEARFGSALPAAWRRERA